MPKISKEYSRTFSLHPGGFYRVRSLRPELEQFELDGKIVQAYKISHEKLTIVIKWKREGVNRFLSLSLEEAFRLFNWFEIPEGEVQLHKLRK